MKSFRRLSFQIICLAALLCLNAAEAGAWQARQRQQDQRPVETWPLENATIKAAISASGLSSLISPSDRFNADVVGNRAWGRTRLLWKTPGGEWNDATLAEMQKSSVTPQKVVLTSPDDGRAVRLEQVYSLTPEGLDIDISIRNTSGGAVRIGDLAVGLPWRRPSGEDPEQIFERGFTKHHFISGNGSFVFFTKPSGEPPFAMVLPKQGTSLEYFDSQQGEYKVFMHSEVSGNAVPGGNWRMSHTGIDLAPSESRSYGFRLRWADSWDDMRQVLYEEGLIDVRVIPGMSLPSDLKAQVSLHTKNPINAVTAEFPGSTTIKYLGEKLTDHHVYEVEFRKLGENLLTVNYGDGQTTQLEFFSTEPVETLIKKRSAFLVNSQQHRDPSKWYNGLYSVYDWRTGVLRGPDDTDGYDGWWGYVLACDDPALGKAPYIAAKNVYFPDEKEIASVEYYLEHFVWNGLQRTDKDDPYPYGVYGVPNWKSSRDPVERAKISSTNLDKMKIWRSYDYPHITMLYYHMYEIAKMYPDKVKYLDAAGYLERAYQTARAYFIYPYEILPWYETYKWGCYNELVIEKLIKDLESEGRQKDADWLRNQYEIKVKYFVYDDKYPFRSEYAIDRTAFESSYAFAKYGTLTEMKPDKNLWFDKNDSVWYSHPVVRKEDSREFMDRQHFAGLAVRGWLEPKYFLMGSDWTASSDNHSLSYMAKMGGWAILDYGVNFSEKPYDWLQLGYASYLSSWALMNTGTEESGYGFWAPGKKNDGAMGWAFMEQKQGNAWIRKTIDRGAWFYDGEADLGLGATFRMATTVLTDDPLFGWVALGGTIEESKKGFLVNPRDGVRNRFSIATTDTRFTVELDRDGFASDSDILVDKKLKKITCQVENRTSGAHKTKMVFFTLPGQKVKVSVNGKAVTTKQTSEREQVAMIDVTKPLNKVVVELQ
ncbi:MAG: hypothetical protein IH591_02520 [Bacteroidales bacterium]|nr:hypothetical protein [Bacteroidales bacterium]